MIITIFSTDELNWLFVLEVAFSGKKKCSIPICSLTTYFTYCSALLLKLACETLQGSVRRMQKRKSEHSQQRPRQANGQRLPLPMNDLTELIHLSCVERLDLKQRITLLTLLSFWQPSWSSPSHGWQQQPLSQPCIYLQQHLSPFFKPPFSDNDHQYHLCWILVLLSLCKNSCSGDERPIHFNRSNSTATLRPFSRIKQV